MQFSRFSLKHGDHQVPRKLLREALLKIDSIADEGQHIVDVGKKIGFNELVEVKEDDEFYEKVRGNRPYPSRYVKDYLPTETSKLQVVWKRTSPNHIFVITAYFTDQDYPYCPDEPANIIRKYNMGYSYTIAEIEKALDFWKSHAFVESLPYFML